MALSDMKVFSDYLQGTTAETVAQMVDKFNAASGGAIVLTSQGIEGDYKYESFWASIHSAQRRVDRYNTNGTPSSTALSQLQSVGVKVAGGFGPIAWEPGQISWIRKSPEEALEVISRNLAEAIVKDQLNTAIACAVAAIEPQATAIYDTGTGPITYTDINTAHAKFGDSSSLIVCNVMDGTAYHNLIAANLANTPTLFQYNSVTVVEILGKRVIVTDAPALRETGTGADQKVLGLVAGGVTVYDGSDVITNVITTNGKNRIETTFQADYSFGVSVKGYAWDTSTGGKTPTDVELTTSGNWDKVATSIKHTAGVLALANI